MDQLLAWGALYYGFAALSPSIAADLGVPSSVVAGGWSVALLVGGLAARPVGRWFDRAGTRTPMVLGAGVGVLAWGALVGARSAPAAGVALAALGLAQALSLYEAAFRTLVDWSPSESDRARATLAVTTVAGFASTVSLPLTTALVDRFGWRAAGAALAIGVSLLLPLRLALTLPASGSDDRVTPPVATGSRSATWLAAAFALQALGSSAVAYGLVWALVERGASREWAAAVAGAAGAAQVPGRLVFAWLRPADERVLPALAAIQAAALFGIAFGTGPIAGVAVLAYGAANGMMTLERATVLVSWYGREAFGAYNGRIGAASTVARAAAPVALAGLHAKLGYSASFGLLAVGLAVAAAASAVARAVRSSERYADIRMTGDAR